MYLAIARKKTNLVSLYRDYYEILLEIKGFYLLIFNFILDERKTNDKVIFFFFFIIIALYKFMLFKLRKKIFLSFFSMLYKKNKKERCISEDIDFINRVASMNQLIVQIINSCHFMVQMIKSFLMSF